MFLNFTKLMYVREREIRDRVEKNQKKSEKVKGYAKNQSSIPRITNTGLDSPKITDIKFFSGSIKKIIAFL